MCSLFISVDLVMISWILRLSSLLFLVILEFRRGAYVLLSNMFCIGKDSSFYHSWVCCYALLYSTGTHSSTYYLDLQMSMRLANIGENVLNPPPLVHTFEDSIQRNIVYSLDVSIILQKGKRTYTSHPILNFVSYYHVSPTHHVFISSLSNFWCSKSMDEMLSHSGWRATIEEEISALL